MKKIKLLEVILLSFVLFGLVGCENDKIQIGILQYVSHGALDSARQGFIDGLKDNGFDTDKVKFTVLNPQAETTSLGSMSKEILRKSDLVLAIATPAAVSVVSEARNNNINKPILFTAVTDPVESNLVSSNENPGGNVTGTNDMNPVMEQIELALELMPELKTIGVVYTSSEVNSQIQVDMVIEKATELGISVETATITSTNDIVQITRNLITTKNIDLLYLPTDNLVSSSMSTITEISEEFDLPTVCGEASMLTNSGLITLGIDYYKLGVLTGEMAAKILSGEKEPATFPVGGLTEFDLIVNKKQADKIGFTIPESILNRAKTILE